jgi:polysaccharide chain length determinant protein (PEP-CTERM system associated)
VAALVAAFVWPRTYRSTSTILIEEQEIPRDFVITTVTGFADQRLQVINQRIMSTTKLLEIISRFNLYADLRRKMTTEEVVEKMRRDIRFATISADVVSQRSATPSSVTIAFTVSYDGKNPQIVQQVANVLASLYLEENLRTREQKTAGASRFLEEEARVLQRNLADVDAKIAAFKARNFDALPELLQLNVQEHERIQRDIEQAREQLKALKTKEEYYETELATIPTESRDQDRSLLKELKAKLVQLESRYTSKYPDVSKTVMEIAALEKRIASRPDEEKGPVKKRLTSVSDQVNNPSYVTLASQLAGVQSDIEAVKRQIADLQQKRGEYLRRTAISPKVEETYKALMVERTNTQAKYEDLMKRVMEAKVAQGLEKEQMGERFTLIDPARLPEKPVKPNVPVILVLGLFLGIGAGAGNILLQEYGDQSVRDPARLALSVPFPLLGTVPEIVNEEDVFRRRARWKRSLIAVIIAFAAFVLIFHLFIMDLEVFWAVVSRRLML